MGIRAPGNAYRVGAAVALGAAVIVVAATWATTRAQIAASTGNSANSWNAGNVDIESDAASRLLFDADDLYPGRVVENCVNVTYTGSVERAQVRVFGDLVGGTGLETYLQVEILAGNGGSHDDCAGFVAAGPPLFTGTLAGLAADHGSFETGHRVLTDAHTGDSKTLRMTIEVADDDAAQALETEFEIVLEARS